MGPLVAVIPKPIRGLQLRLLAASMAVVLSACGGQVPSMNVLELGVGTGRVAIPLATAGLDVTGVDRSEAMLSLAKRKARILPKEVRARLHLRRGDIATLRVRGKFDLAFAAFRVFMSLLTAESQRRALQAVHRRLRPGGLLALDVFDPLLDRVVPGQQPPSERGEVRHPSTGHLVRVTAVERQNDPVAQILTEQWRFAELDHDGKVLREEFENLALRWTYRYEMAHLLELCGFAPLAEYSDYERSPPAYGREQIWLARRKP